jgi:hypothetical protein
MLFDSKHTESASKSIQSGFHDTALNRVLGDDGFGVEIPGYAHTSLVMVRGKHFPYVEF